MLGSFVGTILTILVVFFAGLQTMNSRFDAIDRRFETTETRIGERLQVIDQKIDELNTRLSRIEGHLRIPAAVPDNETPSTGRKETDSDRNIP